MVNDQVQVVAVLLDKFGFSSSVDMQPFINVVVRNRCISVFNLFTQCYGCDVKATDSEGGTTLHHAAASCSEYIVRRLVLQYQYPVDISDAEGYKPLHKAASSGHVRIIRLLLTELKANL